MRQETLEKVKVVKRTELYNSILSIVKQIPRKDVDGDAMDAQSCAYELEKLFSKFQQEQDKKIYGEEEVYKLSLESLDLGMTIRQDQLNGYSEKSGKELHKEWFEQFKKK